MPKLQGAGKELQWNFDGASPDSKSLADAAAFDLDAVIRNEIPLRKQEKIITSKTVQPNHETERNICREVSQLPQLALVAGPGG